MGQENEEVKYSYTGDVSSLKKATEDALGLLGKIESKFQELSSTNSFGTNKRATKSFDSNLQKVLKTAQQVQTKLESLSKTKFEVSYGKGKKGEFETTAPQIRSANAEALTYQQTLTALSNAFDEVADKSSLTTKEVKAFTDVIKQSSADLNASSGRINTTVENEQKFEQTLQKVAAASFKMGDAVKAAMYKVSSVAKVATVPVAAMKGAFQSLQDKAAVALNRTTRVLQAAGAGFRQFKGDAEKAADAEKDVADASEHVREHVKRSAQDINKTQKKIEAGFHAIANAARNIFVGMGKDFSRPFTKVLKFVTKVRKAFERIFLYRVIRSSLQKIEKALVIGIENLYQYSKLFGKDFANSMDSLASSVLYLKNSFGAMAAPLINAVAPIVDMLIDKFVTLINVVGKFFAVLTGKGKFIQAKKVTTEFGEAAEKAAGAVKDFTMSWDELNIISESSSGSAKDAPDYASMFEEVDIDEDQFDWTKRLREAIERGDWESIGRLLAEKFNSIFKNIDWPNLGEKLGKKISGLIHALYTFFNTADFYGLGESLAAFVNKAIENTNFEEAGRLWVKKWTSLVDIALGFFNTLEWGGVAQAIVDFINGAIDEAAAWIAERGDDFIKLAKSIADAINKCIAEIKWEDLARTISDYFIAALDTINTFLAEFDWEGLGDTIHDFLFNLDWPRIVEGLVTGFSLAVVGIGKLLWGFIKDEWANTVNWWHENAFEDGKLSVQKLFDGMAQWFAEHDPVTWIAEHMCKPTIDAVKKGFGLDTAESETAKIGKFMSQGLMISLEKNLPPLKCVRIFRNIVDIANQVFKIGSPSKVFEEIGDFMVQGLFIGLSNIGTKISTWGSDVTSRIKKVLGIHSPSKEMEEIGDFMVQGLFIGLENINQYLLKLLKDFLELISSNSVSSIQELKEKISQFVEWVNQALNEMFGQVQVQTKAMTVNIINMYQTMANSSVASINRIISALNSIPRNITTTHTIIQQTGGSNLDSGGSSSSSSSAAGKAIATAVGTVATVAAGIATAIGGAFRFASGGVVSAPTYALVGEAGHPEAVVPLGNSPQLDEMLDRFAEKVQSTGSSQPVEVKVYIGDKEWDAFTYKSAQRGQKLVGAIPINIGG